MTATVLTLAQSAPRPSAGGGPLAAVLRELEKGTPTIIEMARNAGIAEDMVRASLDHLVRTGRVHVRELPIGCPATGCGGCGLTRDCQVQRAK